MELDNTHFAGEATSYVAQQEVPVTIKKDEYSNEYGKEIRVLYLAWEIAFKNGGVKLDTGKVQKNKKQMFD